MGRMRVMVCSVLGSEGRAGNYGRGVKDCRCAYACGAGSTWRGIVEAWAFYRGVELDSDFKVAPLLALFAGRKLLNAAAI